VFSDFPIILMNCIHLHLASVAKTSQQRGVLCPPHYIHS
jgi:hypothetical protein